MLLCLLFRAATAFCADPKVGTVDMKRVFEAYWKTAVAGEDLQDLRESIKRKLDAQYMAKQSAAAIKASAEKFEKELQTRQMDLRKFLRDDIFVAVTQFAEREGFDLMIDSSGEGFNQIEFVLHSVPQLDVTQAIIDLINDGRPSGQVAGTQIFPPSEPPNLPDPPCLFWKTPSPSGRLQPSSTNVRGRFSRTLPNSPIAGQKRQRWR